MDPIFARIYARPSFSELSPLMKEAVEKNEKEQKEKMGAALAALVNSFEGHLRGQVQTLRLARKQERELTAKVKSLDRAMRYFLSHNNPLPFYKTLGLVSHGASWFRNLTGETLKLDDPLWDIPEDFKSESPEA